MKYLSFLFIVVVLNLHGNAEAQIATGKAYRIVSMCDANKVMAIKDGGFLNETPIVLAENAGNNTQIFRIDASGKGYVFTSTRSNKVFDIHARSTAPGAALIQNAFANPSNGISTQVFAINISPPYGIATIQNLKSGLFIGIDSAAANVGDGFTQRPLGLTCTQRFRLLSLDVTLATDKVFAPDSFWYKPIPTDAPLATNSADLVADFLRQKDTYYQTVAINTYSYSSPVYTVADSVATVTVEQWDCSGGGLDRGLRYQWADVPIPDYAVPSPGTDGEMTIYQPATDTIWEFWRTRKVDGRWEACWGGQISEASKNPGIWPAYYGATATGLPFLGGQVTAEELRRGSIRHAIGIALVEVSRLISWPAARTDGNGAGLITEGQRFRLDPSIDVNTLGLSPAAKTIARAAQRYGFVVWDQAGAITLRAQNALSYTASGGKDPYPAVYVNRQVYDVLKNFPWDRLQFLPIDYGRP